MICITPAQSRCNVRNFRRFRFGVSALVCLGFTLDGVAWADSAQNDIPLPKRASYVEDPYAPHVTDGATVRLGTTVGFIYGERLDVSAVGLSVAGGQRFGRLTLEAEFDYLGFEQRDPPHAMLGSGERLGVVARFDMIRLGPHWVGPNSLLSVYVEGGAAQAWNNWYRASDLRGMQSRVVPDNTRRVEGQVGFGIVLDHRLQEPISFPHRIGWFLGWRLGLAPHDAETASICRGTTCRPASMMPEDSYTDRSMLFQSSLAFTW
jgi:hypothetical protein